MAFTLTRVSSSNQEKKAWLSSQLFKLTKRLYPLLTSADTHLAKINWSAVCRLFKINNQLPEST